MTERAKDTSGGQAQKTATSWSVLWTRTTIVKEWFEIEEV